MTATTAVGHRPGVGVVPMASGAGSRPTIALALPHGIAARNFILSGFTRTLAKRADVVLIHPLRERLDAVVGERASDYPSYPSPPHSEGPFGFLVRQSAKYAHLRVWDTVGMRHVLRQSRPRGPWTRTRLASSVAWHAARLLGTPAALDAADTVYLRSQASRPTTHRYREVLAGCRADVLLCCDQRPPEMTPAILAARSLGIPAGTFVFSWDNLSSKGRMPCRFDFYLVWSELMKEELLRFYPGVDGSSVHVTGTPQFEVYGDPSLLVSREEFCATIGADPGRPIICFSGEVPATDPENPEHFAALAQLVADDRIDGEPQLLLRPSPGDGPERWNEVRRRFEDILWCPPRWSHRGAASWEGAIPTAEDQALVANTVRHSALGVNLSSTMTLDFAICGKPTVNIAFDLSDPPPFGVPVADRLFRFEHYRPVVELGAASIARSPEELAEHVNRLLRDPGIGSEARERLVRLETDDTIGSANENLAAALLRHAEPAAEKRASRF